MQIKRLFAVTGIVFFVGAALVALVIWLQWHQVQYKYHMLSIRKTISDGEQSWAEKVAGALADLDAEVDDKIFLVDCLLDEEDPNLVAQGLIWSVKHDHPDCANILAAHAQDNRVNWHLMTNADLCITLQRIYVSANDDELTDSDRRFKSKWIDGMP